MSDGWSNYSKPVEIKLEERQRVTRRGGEYEEDETIVEFVVSLAFDGLTFERIHATRSAAIACRGIAELGFGLRAVDVVRT